MKVANRQTVIISLAINGDTSYNQLVTFSRVKFQPTHVIVRQITQSVAAPVVDLVSITSDFTGDNTLAITPGFSCVMNPLTVIPVTGPIQGNKRFSIETLTNTAFSIGLLLEFIEEVGNQ